MEDTIEYGVISDFKEEEKRFKINRIKRYDEAVDSEKKNILHDIILWNIISTDLLLSFGNLPYDKIQAAVAMTDSEVINLALGMAGLIAAPFATAKLCRTISRYVSFKNDVNALKLEINQEFDDDEIIKIK